MPEPEMAPSRRVNGELQLRLSLAPASIPTRRSKRTYDTLHRGDGIPYRRRPFRRNPHLRSQIRAGDRSVGWGRRQLDFCGVGRRHRTIPAQTALATLSGVKPAGRPALIPQNLELSDFRGVEFQAVEVHIEGSKRSA